MARRIPGTRVVGFFCAYGRSRMSQNASYRQWVNDRGVCRGNGNSIELPALHARCLCHDGALRGVIRVEGARLNVAVPRPQRLTGLYALPARNARKRGRLLDVCAQVDLHI